MPGLDEMCKKVFAVDPAIRFAGVIDRMGKLVAGGMRDGVSPLESIKDMDKLYIEFALRNAMRKEFNVDFGKTIFTFSERERIKLATFPLKDDDDSLLLVSIEKDKPHDKIISGILAVVR
ncbi:DUF6659 family protein [Nitrososphaera viennensis]|uniref:Roadblock/LAMTOR2 domain-containing protein n=2 Tax=Nitrososphaera viennensis TaxID=1034015 RepID=A0A060HG61_9ARCH|nr:DUF6659 family protein [Nitrososphaera viennensis]AIC15619.1 hypothetical protein NVIE_013800 [Nitrososphaera viennensis EN76]UVS70495.1 hypothetical protein NWT39_06845 [Nitrososphaera viennensis]